MSTYEVWREPLQEINTRISIEQAKVQANKDTEPFFNAIKELAAYYQSYTDKTPDFCMEVTRIYEGAANVKNVHFALLEKDIAKVYIDAMTNPKYGAFTSGKGDLWKLLTIATQLSTAKRIGDFVECGYLKMMVDLKASTQDPTNTAYTTSIMNVFHTVGNEKEYARLVVEPMVALIKLLDPNTFESRTYLSHLYNVVSCDRERVFNEHGVLLEEVKNRFLNCKNQTIRQILFDFFGVKNAEYVSLLIDFAGSKKKYSFPITKEEETTVEIVTQFILEKCVDDVEILESHELQIYDMDLEDYVDFDFIDTDVFEKDGTTAKFKLTVTVDLDKKRKKEEQKESELRELSEKSMSIITLSEKHLSDSIQSSQKFDNSIDSSGIEMSSMDMSGKQQVSRVPMSGIQMSGIDMSGIQMSGIQLSGVDMSGIEMSAFSQNHSISGIGGPLEMPSFVSAADNAPRVELTENSLLGGSFDIPDSFKEPVTTQKDKKTKKIVNETYQILDKIESDDSVLDRKVYIAKDLGNKSGPNIVIKYLPIKSSTEFNRCMKEGVNMIRMGRTIQQKKIPLANIFDVFEEEDKEHNKASIRFLCFAMPYYGGGNLLNYIISKKSLDWTLVFSLFKQIVNAIIYLHDQKIAHKNLKLSNIFFVDKENIVLTDYGLNSEVSSQVPEHNSLNQVENIPIEKFQKADIYQAGLVFTSLCLVLNGKSFTNVESLIKEGDNNLRNALGNIPEKAKDLICNMLKKDPNERPSIQQTLNSLDI